MNARNLYRCEYWGGRVASFHEADARIRIQRPESGQFCWALQQLQAQILAGVPTTSQPFFENQIGAGGTAFVVNNYSQQIEIGNASETVQPLYADGALAPNLGLSGQFSTNAYITNLGSSSYNGLLVSLRRRFSQGLQFDVNYTWSHSIDNQSSIVNTVFGGLVCDVRNLRVCRGNSDFDIRHLVNVNGIYELPFGSGKRFGGDSSRWVDALIGGFQLTVFIARSGLPCSRPGFIPGKFRLRPTGRPERDAMRAGQIMSPGGYSFFADPAAALGAFRNPRGGETGNRNTLRGPYFYLLDMALLKNFRLPWSETQRLQIRVEAFNALNHNSFGLPNANINGTTFGNITTSSSTPRELQFGIRWDF